MSHSLGWLKKLVVVLAIVGYPLLVHWTFLGGVTGWLRLVVVWAPIVLFGVWALRKAERRLWWCSVVLVAAVVTWVAEHQEHLGLVAAYGVPHAACYFFLLALFGRTLFAGHEPLIARLAARVNGAPLSDSMQRYMRGATVAWCVFFAAQIIVSGILYLSAPLAVWSFFINVLNMPLVLMMFVGEYLYRVICHPEFPKATIAQAIASFMNDTGAETKVESL